MTPLDTPHSRLFVDFASSGHHAKYLRQLVRYGLRADAAVSARLMISRELMVRTETELTATERILLRERASLLEEQPAYIRLVRWMSVAMAERCFVEYLVATQPADCEVTLLYLDPFIFQLVCLPLPRDCVSGLLFRTSFHYRHNGFRLEGFREYLLFVAKYAICYLGARRRGVKRIFVLDPFAQSYAEQKWHSSKYVAIPDPVGPEPGAPPSFFAKSQRETGARRVMLLCGELSRRKGVLVVLRAILMLEPHYLDQLQFRFVGPVHDSERETVMQALHRTRMNRTLADITLVDRFCSGDEFDQCILESDVVLTLYKRSFGSSATVIRAALLSRPVIATDQGLVGRLVRVHRVGAVVDVRDQRAVAQAFRNFLDTGMIREFDPKAAREYADSCAPQAFAERMFALPAAVDGPASIQHQKELI